MPQYVGMPDEPPIQEADEFVKPDTAKMVHSQGRQRNVARQQHLLRFLTNSGTSGGTAREAVDYLHDNFDPAEYHGPVSGALTVMRDAGLIVMLAQKRGRFHIYVLPEHVAGRPVKHKEEIVFGSKTKESDEVIRLRQDLATVTAKATHLAEQNAALASTIRARDVQIDNLLEQSARDAKKARETNEALQRKLDEANESVNTNFTAVTNLSEQVAALKESEQSLRERAEDAEAALVQAPPAAPRKVITAHEKTILTAVAKAIQGRGDGTKDSPERITLKVSTVRTLGAALQRITSD